MSDPDLTQIVTSVVRDALDALLPDLISNRLAADASLGAMPPDDIVNIQAEAEANAAAEAERQRWESMPAEELAQHEAAAAIVRYREGLTDALERGGDLDGVEAHGATLAPADVASVRAEVRAAMAAAGQTAAVALIDAGLPSRKKQISDALGRIAAGKGKPEDIALLAQALTAA